MATGGLNTDMLSDETFDLLCTVCKNEGKNTEAVKYCTDCAYYYCSTCVKVHDNVPLLKGHKILDQGKAKAETRKQLPVVPTERCDRHGHKPVDMYCQNHDNVGCAACMAVEHRPCQDIFYIPELIQTKATASTTQNTKGKLESTEKTLKTKLQDLEQEKQNLLKRKAESIENVRQFRREVNKKIDEMETNSVAEIEDKYKAVIQQIEDEIRVLQENKKDVTSARYNLLSAGNNVSQMFVSTKKGQAAVSKAEKSLEERNARIQTEEITFTADLKLSKLLEEFNYLGQIKMKIKGVKRHDVKIPSDTTDCDIFSSCFLEDGTVMLADQSNKKLKHLDNNNYSVRDYYDLPGTPWQVCSINNQEVAVSIRGKSFILFISTGNKMTKKSSMKVDFNCYGLAYAGNNLYISSKVKTVYMYTLSGQQLKKFNLDLFERSNFLETTLPFLNGDQYYNSIHGLAVSKDGSKIYIAANSEGLIILDNTGEVIKKFNEQFYYNDAKDCYVTDRGSVLVSGSHADYLFLLKSDGELMGEVVKSNSCNGPMLEGAYDCNTTDRGSALEVRVESNNVLQLTSDGELIGEVGKSDSCQSVCCNQQMSKMIVGKHFSNEIEVYDLV